MKKSQHVMVWLLPLIVIGGLFYPRLGYLVVGMMGFLLALSFSRGRFWCAHLCPRGAFLDLVMAHASPGRPLPRVFMRPWFRWSVLILLMSFLSWRIVSAGGSWQAIGAVFVLMCLATTVVAILLALGTRHRAWCAVCPMGLLQGKIHQAAPKKNGRGH
jgi:ferredoxin-type protein NapH